MVQRLTAIGFASKMQGSGKGKHKLLCQQKHDRDRGGSPGAQGVRAHQAVPQRLMVLRS
jgi:hypothetical protein